MRKRVLILTGSPGTGKTTVLMKTVEALKAQGYSVGGMLSREVREGAVRVGFEILDLASGRRGWLAHVNQKSGPRVGRYRVNLQDLDAVGAAAISEAVERSDVVAIDEIGPMELFSDKFKQAARTALDSSRLVLAVVHWKGQDMLINEARKRADAETFVITTENRGNLHEAIAEKAAEFLADQKHRNPRVF
jgi:nucleoside-triphosphatase